jgi:hypothetical protein
MAMRAVPAFCCPQPCYLWLSRPSPVAGLRQMPCFRHCCCHGVAQACPACTPYNPSTPHTPHTSPPPLPSPSPPYLSLLQLDHPREAQYELCPVGSWCHGVCGEPHWWVQGTPPSEPGIKVQQQTTHTITALSCQLERGAETQALHSKWTRDSSRFNLLL